MVHNAIRQSFYKRATASACLVFALQIALADEKVLAWVAIGFLLSLFYWDVVCCSTYFSRMNGRAKVAICIVGIGILAAVTTKMARSAYFDGKQKLAKEQDMRSDYKKLQNRMASLEGAVQRMTGAREVRLMSTEASGIDLTLNKVKLRLGLVEATPSKWEFIIHELVISNPPGRTDLSGGRGTLMPGAPFPLVIADDAALVVDVFTLPSGKSIPWAGLVDPKTIDLRNTHSFFLQHIEGNLFP